MLCFPFIAQASTDAIAHRVESVVPKGVSITAISQTKNGFLIRGVASRNGLISLFIKNIGEKIGTPKLSSVKKHENGTIFELSVIKIITVDNSSKELIKNNVSEDISENDKNIIRQFHRGFTASETGKNSLAIQIYMSLNKLGGYYGDEAARRIGLIYLKDEEKAVEGFRYLLETANIGHDASEYSLHLQYYYMKNYQEGLYWCWLAVQNNMSGHSGCGAYEGKLSKQEITLVENRYKQTIEARLKKWGRTSKHELSDLLKRGVHAGIMVNQL